MNADRLMFNTKEAAEYINVGTRFLEKLRQQGDGPPYVKLGKKPRSPVRYRKADLDRYLAEHTQSNTSQQPLSSS